jgi:hypothetical protein
MIQIEAPAPPRRALLVKQPGALDLLASDAHRWPWMA